MHDIQKNPSNLNLYLKDQRVMQALAVLLNFKLRTAQGGASAGAGAGASAEPEPELVTRGGGKEKREWKALALKEEEAGNAAHKKKDFETAIQHYTKASALDIKDISFLTNRADVYLEMGKKALTKHCNPDTLKKLNDVERAKKEPEQQEYFDPKIANEEHEKGNEYSKERKFPEAVSYKEEPQGSKDTHQLGIFMLDADTFGHSRTRCSLAYAGCTSRLCSAYNNRATCYTKLRALPEGLKDAEKCIELDPSFVKGYTRKEYDKALETYQKGLEHGPYNQELLDGVRRYSLVLAEQSLAYGFGYYAISLTVITNLCRQRQWKTEKFRTPSLTL
ncbi:hypothetical protein Cgig2_008893 [Carnegiea gigantea]|uniref:STI1/HOP DP domain-containing protein n=1 Tax=Carnegiea gigantea TaxID=171969 RepID=A0A9Q1KI68_9CARY|nr:hypothetical protein Cgig2_008893 [Carnegiea gigantea]